MPQLNVYVPDDLAGKIRRAAKKQGKSLSAYLTDVVRSHVEPASKGWPKDFFSKVMGSWDGKFPAIEDQPPEDADAS